MRRHPRSQSWLSSAGIAALVALVIADVALVVRAFDHVAASPRTPSSASAPVTPGTAPHAQPSASPPTNGFGEPEGEVLLTLAADGTVLRATSGSCSAGTPGTLDVSGPGGAHPRGLGLPSELTEVLTVEADAPGRLVVVGTDRDCRPRAWTIGADGRTWAAIPVDDRWFLTPGGAPEVHAPGGRIEVPCQPAALSTVNAVRLVCETGTILGTSDGGSSWAPLGRVDAAAVAYDGPSRGVALASRPNCPVAVLTTTNGGAGWDRTACLDGQEGLTVAVRDELVAALVDDVVWRSGDAGATWQRAG